MPVIYMKHPIHGEKVASLDAEARADELRGWVRVIRPTPNPLAFVAPAVEPVVAAVEKRRGRPPKVTQ